jgi:hypothetical protein
MCNDYDDHIRYHFSIREISGIRNNAESFEGGTVASDTLFAVPTGCLRGKRPSPTRTPM